MEFPDLGAQCHEKTCNRLDFLPMKCDACSYIFCNNHVHYSKHNCEKAYEKDIQVPVCPLCNNPVPTKRGQLPDLEVEQHILRDCMSDPAVNKRTVYFNKCNVKGCKQKELIPVTCAVCNKNYCLKHRHATDHTCVASSSSSRPMSQAGAAALARTQNTNSFPHSTFANMQLTEQEIWRMQQMTDEEAMAIAVKRSLREVSAINEPAKVIQEREDRLLAEALVASEKGGAAKQIK